MLKTRLIAAVVLLAAPIAAAQSTWPKISRLAEERFGEPGQRAAAFLAENRPDRDDAIDPEIVLESIGVALRARETYPWAADVSDELFLNDVLPYATLDEPRVITRERVHDLAAGLVDGATTAEEAAQALNRELFKLTGVRYSTQRLRANQNSAETLDTGLASCTGLSILLVDACRSVGIPARVAGIANWTDRNGNHTWVEIHDGERWRFTGAAEYDKNGLDRGWFTGPASMAIEGHELHAIWASSWSATGNRFPLAWNMADRSVPGAGDEAGSGIGLSIVYNILRLHGCSIHVESVPGSGCLLQPSIMTVANSHNCGANHGRQLGAGVAKPITPQA